MFLELAKSAIADDIARLNVSFLEGDEAIDSLLWGLDESDRRNDGRVRDRWLINYSHLRDGGLAFFGVDPLTGDRLDCLSFKPARSKTPDRKYENPPKVGSQAIYSAVTYRVWKLVCERFGVALPPDLTTQNPETEAKGFWAWAIENNLPILLTEGAKKALAAISHGFPAIALAGIWNGSIAVRDENGKSKGFELIFSLEPIATPDRQIFIAFDRDKKASVNKAVIDARSTLAKLLIDRGAKPYSTPWDIEFKGLDDLIFNCGIETLEKAIEQAELLTGESPNFKKKPAPNILAEKIAKELKNRLAFDASGKVWRWYEGGVWGEKIIEEIERYFYERVCQDVPELLPIYVENVVKVSKWKLLESRWDEVSSLDFIPFKNGVWDVKNNKLLPHSPDFKFTWKLDRDYPIAGGKFEKIDRFLNEVTRNNQQLKNILISAANAVLLGRSDLQKAIYLVGAGGNGKGSFLRLLEMLVGHQNTHSTTLHDLCENTFELANIYKKRLIICPDEDKRIGGLSRFKSITGGDSIRGEKKGKDAFKFRFEGLVAIASNDPIFLGDTSYGLSRRLITIPFKFQVPTNQRRDLTAEFEADLPAFTAYLLSLDPEWVKNTLLGSSEVAEIKATEWDLTTRTDSIAGFFDENLIFDSTAKTATIVLYSNYQDYCKASGLQAKSIHKFVPEMVDLCAIKLGLGVRQYRDRAGRYILGLRFRSASDDACDGDDALGSKASSPQNPLSKPDMTLMTLSSTNNGKKNNLEEGKKEELGESPLKNMGKETPTPQSVIIDTLGSQSQLESVTQTVINRHQPSQASSDLMVGDRVRIRSSGENGILSTWKRDRQSASVQLEDGDLTEFLPLADLEAI